MENQLNTKRSEGCFEHEVQLELLLDKQDYLDYIDADMEAFYAIKADTLGFDVTGL